MGSIVENPLSLLTETESRAALKRALKFARDNLDASVMPYSNLERMLTTMTDDRDVRRSCVDPLYARFTASKASSVMTDSASFDVALAAFKAVFDSFSSPEDFKAAWSTVEPVAKAFVAAVTKYTDAETTTWLPMLMTAMNTEAKNELCDNIRTKHDLMRQAKILASMTITDHRAAKKAAKAAEKARLAEEEENGITSKGGKPPKMGKKKAKAAKAEGSDDEGDGFAAAKTMPVQPDMPTTTSKHRGAKGGLASAASSPQPFGMGSPMRKDRTASIGGDPSHLHL